MRCARAQFSVGRAAVIIFGISASLPLRAGELPQADQAQLQACRELLDAYGECTVIHRQDGPCLQRVGSAFARCMLLEAEVYGDAPEQVAALRALNAVVEQVSVEAYDLSVDADVLRACHLLVKELPRLGLVRRAVVTSVSREAAQQERLLARDAKLPRGRRYAARRSNHQLGLACDVHISGYSKYTAVLAEAAQVLQGRLGSEFRLHPEPGISVIHVEPHFARSPRYRELRAARIGRLVGKGVLPHGTRTDETPRYDRYQDTRG